MFNLTGKLRSSKQNVKVLFLPIELAKIKRRKREIIFNVVRYGVK